MKMCVTCKQKKDLTEFRKDARRGDGHQSSCRLCVSSRIKEAYHTRYKERYLPKVKRETKRRRDINRQKIAEYKQMLGCRFCSETEPVCLEFHHLDPSAKEHQIANSLGMNIEALFEEIKQKCICLCSNCHKKVHAGILVV